MKRVRRTFVARAPNKHPGWAIYDTCFVARLNDNDHLLTFRTYNEARQALGLKEKANGKNPRPPRIRKTLGKSYPEHSKTMETSPEAAPTP